MSTDADLLNDNVRLVEVMHQIAKLRLTGATWPKIAEIVGVSKWTMLSWERRPKGRMGLLWRSVLAEEAALRKMPDPKADENKLDTTGFETPEQFCDHWSLEAARIQVETMLDVKANRRERIDASKRVQDLGGHSPINRSVVITAPLDDPRTRDALLGVLAEVKQLKSSEALQIETTACASQEA